MPSGSNELAADSHLRLGITWAGFLKFLRCELRFINPGDFLVQKAIRRTDDENWVTQSFGPIRSLKYAASGSTGYDVCGHIRCWLKGRSAEKQSVCEVLRGQGGEWTDHIGDANVFYSHLQKPSISDTLASMRLGMDVHESRLPPEQDCYPASAGGGGPSCLRQAPPPCQQPSALGGSLVRGATAGDAQTPRPLPRQQETVICGCGVSVRTPSHFMLRAS